MSTYNDPVEIRKAALGLQVEKTAAVAASGSATDLFSVDGGSIWLLGLIGDVETVLVADTDLDIDFDPDDGGTDVALSTTLVADSDPTGTLYTLNSALTGGGIGIESLDVAYNGMFASPFFLTVGDIKLTSGGGGAGGGSIHWYAYWLPADAGGVLSAA